MAMFGAAKKSASHFAALDRVTQWTRARFKLQAEDAILVAEVACAVPGCPPLETVVAFWTADATRHHFKLFKQVEEVVADDLPYTWLMKSLAATDGFDDCC